MTMNANSPMHGSQESRDWFLFVRVKARCGLVNKRSKVHRALYQAMRGESQRTKVSFNIHDSSKALVL